MVVTAHAPQYNSPDKVQWPSQFVADDGRLLTSGAFDKDEAPFGSGVCLLCGTGNLAGAGAAASSPPPTAHICLQGHCEKRCRVRQEYFCFWQELIAPDQRPYFYDHVSHSWSFAKPRCLAVPAGSPEAEPEVDYAESDKLRERLSRTLASVFSQGSPEGGADGSSVVLSGQGWVPVHDPYPGFQCEYCKRVFGTEWAASQHISGMSGRKGHPLVPGGWEAAWPRCDAAGAGLGDTGACAVATAGLPATGDGLATSTHLNPEADVAEAEKDGRMYYYNSKTLATAWTRNDLVRLNREFYASVRWVQVAPFGPDGQDMAWAWQGPGGVVREGRLCDLYSLAQKTLH